MAWPVLRLLSGVVLTAALAAQNSERPLRVYASGSGVPPGPAASMDVVFGEPFELVVEFSLRDGDVAVVQAEDRAAIKRALEPVTARALRTESVMVGERRVERRTYRAVAYSLGTVVLADGQLTLRVRSGGVEAGSALEVPGPPPAPRRRAPWFPFGLALFAIVVAVEALRSRSRRRTVRNDRPERPRDAARAALTALDIERCAPRDAADVIDRSLRIGVGAEDAGSRAATRTAEEWGGTDERLAALFSRCEALRYGDAKPEPGRAVQALRDDALSYLSGAPR